MSLKDLEKGMTKKKTLQQSIESRKTLFLHG